MTSRILHCNLLGTIPLFSGVLFRHSLQLMRLFDGVCTELAVDYVVAAS